MTSEATPTVESLWAEEASLQLAGFDAAAAWWLGQWLVERCRREGYRPTIDIRRAGHQLFHCSFEGTAADNDVWVRRKARTVFRFGHSSWSMGLSVARDRTTAAARYFVDESRFCFYPGGVPILVQGTGLVASLALSGLPQVLDHTLAVESLRALAARGE